MQVQDICQAIRNLEEDYDYNEFVIQAAHVEGKGDLKRLYLKREKLLAEIYSLQNRRESFYD